MEFTWERPFNKNVMKLLMTPAEVVGMVFGEGIPPDIIGDSTVMAAQLRYMKPVLGDSFYKALEEGRYTAFVGEWVKPALALFVKYMVLPAVAFHTGELGVVQFGGDHFHAAEAKDIAGLRRVVRSQAETALYAVVLHIESSPDTYPEYDSDENIKRRISVSGGIVM